MNKKQKSELKEAVTEAVVNEADNDERMARAVFDLIDQARWLGPRAERLLREEYRY